LWSVVVVIEGVRVASHRFRCVRVGCVGRFLGVF